MRRLTLRTAAAVVTVLGAVALLLVPEAGSQVDGYPPGTTTTVVDVPTTVPGEPTTIPGAPTTVPGAPTTVPGATTVPVAPTTVPGAPTTVAACIAPTGSQDVGGVNVGETFTIRIQPACPFDVGSLVSLTVNGQGIGTKEADAAGGINVVVRVVSQTTIEIDDPITVAAQCGVNTVVASGESVGTPVTQTATFTIQCPGGAAQPVRGRVAFTGANLLRWGASAAALLALGGVLLVTARRRSRSTTSA